MKNTEFKILFSYCLLISSKFYLFWWESGFSLGVILWKEIYGEDLDILSGLLFIKIIFGVFRRVYNPTITILGKKEFTFPKFFLSALIPSNAIQKIHTHSYPSTSHHPHKYSLKIFIVFSSKIYFNLKRNNTWEGSSR